MATEASDWVASSEDHFPSVLVSRIKSYLFSIEHPDVR